MRAAEYLLLLYQGRDYRAIGSLSAADLIGLVIGSTCVLRDYLDEPDYIVVKLTKILRQ
jgi:hypothetical protein